MSTTNMPGDEDSPKRTRLDDELLEILQKNDRPISFVNHVRRKAARQRQVTPSRTAGLKRSRLWPVAPMIAAFAVAFLGLAVRDTSALLASLLAWISVALFVLPIVPRFRRPTDASVKRWRGRDIDLSSPRRDWLGELRDRVSGKPRL